MISVSLKEMLETLVECILNNKEFPNYYWKTTYDNSTYNYYQITEVDLLRNRFYVSNGDFSEFNWELEESRIFMEE